MAQTDTDSNVPYCRPNAADFAALAQRGYSYHQIAEVYETSYKNVQGGISEYNRRLTWLQQHKQLPDLQPTPQGIADWQNDVLDVHLNNYEDIQAKIPIQNLPDPITLQGDCVIFGDVQLPTTDYEFAQLPLMIGWYELQPPRTCIIAGDFINGDAFSGYDETIGTASYRTEIQSARRFLEDFQQVFDRIIWFMGNHERRIPRKTQGAIDATLLSEMITLEDYLEVSEWGHCLVETIHGTYRITHARNYSINQLTVADALAQKYQQHIINHHEHHLAKGYDRYKNFVIVNNGGLFDRNSMAYAILDDSKSAGMAPGFTLLKNGTADVFGETPYTDWTPYEQYIRLMRRDRVFLLG